MITAPNLPPEFQSGNNIPAERATISRERMAEIQLDAYQAGRDAALEEAARICDETYVEPGDLQVESCHEAAATIRALKSDTKGGV